MLRLPKRLQSIDVFRAVTMFFMIFVNDVDGVTKIPQWIKHVDAHADALGFADTIFPAFLFIVGLSIPFALSKRMQSGENKLKAIWHIVFRSLALIIMGTFHVNTENYSDTAILPEPVFEILITLAFFLIWLDYKPSFSNTAKFALQATGVAILIAMFFLYRGQRHNVVVGMRPYWWGILGLIGWGYLTCSLIYLFIKGNFNKQVIIFLFMLAFNVFSHIKHFKFLYDNQFYKWFAGNCSMCCFITAGIITSLFYMRNKENEKRFFSGLILLAITFIAFGFITRPVAGISKDHDTPAWIGICTGISIAVFTVLIFLVDKRKKANWFNVIKPAGTSTLTCYLLPYFLYSFMAVFNLRYPEFFNEGVGGIIRSFAVAFAVIFVTGFFEKKQLRLKI